MEEKQQQLLLLLLLLLSQKGAAWDDEDDLGIVMYTDEKVGIPMLRVFGRGIINFRCRFVVELLEMIGDTRLLRYRVQHKNISKG
jgi:hypothetical protein